MIYDPRQRTSLMQYINAQYTGLYKEESHCTCSTEVQEWAVMSQGEQET